MKKSLLLLTAGLIAGVAHGQEAAKGMLFQPAVNVAKSAGGHMESPAGNITGLSAPSHARYSAKTTLTAGRWYNFAFLEDTLLGGPTNIGASYPYMWFTDQAKFPYGSAPTTFQANNNVSTGTIFDPKAAGFDDQTLFSTGILAVNNLTAYTVDSVQIAGVYHRNHANHTDVDTLRLAYTYGGLGTAGSNIGSYYRRGYATTYSGVDTINYATLYWDSTKNIATKNTTGTRAVVVQDILLRESDTTGTSVMDTLIKLNTAMTPAANELCGLTMTFKSGNPAANATFTDTVWRSGGDYKYGEFRPLFYNNNTGGALHWPDVINSNPVIGWNMGLQQLEPASRGTGQTTYFPAFALTAGTSANSDQYPWIGFHVVCPTCPVIGPALGVNTIIAPSSVKVYPNPATNELNISFSSKVPVTVTLSNMLGQVVATDNVANGHSTINTAALPAGVYIFSLNANGERTTGRVAIGH